MVRVSNEQVTVRIRGNCYYKYKGYNHNRIDWPEFSMDKIDWLTFKERTKNDPNRPLVLIADPAKEDDAK